MVGLDDSVSAILRELEERGDHMVVGLRCI